MAVASLTIANAHALGSEPLLEVGPLTTKNGTKLSCIYSTDGGQWQDIYLIYPNGKKVTITMERPDPNSHRIEFTPAERKALLEIAEKGLAK